MDRRVSDVGPPSSGERRRGGRPRVGRPVLVHLPDTLYADLCAEAQAYHNGNVSAAIRARCVAVSYIENPRRVKTGVSSSPLAVRIGPL